MGVLSYRASVGIASELLECGYGVPDNEPAEWVFLTVLYLFDDRPQDRIASQYLLVDISKNLN